MGTDALHDLTAAYALDALDESEARAYEEHLAGCEACREDLASLQAVSGALALAAGPAEPPHGLRGRILEAARAERPNVVPLRPRFSRPLAAVAAVAACAAVGLGIWNVALHDRLGRTQQALRGVPLTGATGSVVIDRGNAALVVSNLAPAPVGETYEAWVITGGNALPAGTFAGGSRTTVFELTRSLPAGSVVAVTVERAGGVDHPTRKPFITSESI